MHSPITALRAALASTLILFSLLALPARAAVVGEQKTAVILVNFTDNTEQTRTVAEVQKLVFGDTSDYLWENSYHQAFLSGDVFGWYTIPLSATLCDIGVIADEGNKAATAAGANLANYEQVIYMFPSNSGCGWSGTGGPNLTGQRQIFIHAAAGFSVKVIAHELGHRYGLMHSDGWDCDAGPNSGNCLKQGYADPTDVMGNRTGQQVARAFQDLAAAVDSAERRSFDEIAEDLLRPMLQDWLDDNLPTLVERLVREEIERVARGPRR